MYVKHVTSEEGPFLVHLDHNLNKLCEGPIDDAPYQYPGSKPCVFRQEDFLSFPNKNTRKTGHVPLKPCF